MRISPRTKPFLMVLALLAGVMALTWQNPAPAAACSCAVPTAAEWAEMVDAVAEGTVAEAHVPDIGSGEDAGIVQPALVEAEHHGALVERASSITRIGIPPRTG